MKLRTAVDKLLLRLAVPAKRLQTAAVALRLGVGVSAKRLRVALGQFVALLYPTDTATTSDGIGRVVGKALSDAPTIEPRIEMEFRKDVNEAAGIDAGSLYFGEDYVEGAPGEQTYTVGVQAFRDVAKPLGDAAAAVSLAAILMQYGRSDAYAASDTDVLTVGKGLSEVPLWTSVLGRVTTKVLADTSSFGGDSQYFAQDYVVGAPSSQTYTLGTQVVISVTKGVADSVATVSSIVLSMQFTRPVADTYSGADASLRTVGKVLGHGVGATDDLNGALPLDDQTVAFFKSLDHITGAADSAVRVFQRGLFESAAASEQSARLVGKSRADVAAASSDQTVTSGKVLAHAASTADSAVRVFQRNMSESAATAEQLARVVGKPRSDSVSLADSIVYALVTAKALTDSAASSDNSSRLAGKVSADSAGADSSGTLRSQGYTVDMTYFAEDYVGASRTF
jgi:hypothetical protein